MVPYGDKDISLERTEMRRGKLVFVRSKTNWIDQVYKLDWGERKGHVVVVVIRSS